MAHLRYYVVLAIALSALLPASQAQILPEIDLYAQLHRFNVYPDNQTAYGTPRQFKALIANIATSNATAEQKMNGTLTFLGNAGQSLCNATLNNNITMSGKQLAPTEVDPTLAVGALNNIIANNNLTEHFGTINTNALLANSTQTELNATLGPIQLYPLRIAAGAVAECTQSYLTPSTYYALEAAYSNVTLNGSQVGAGVLPVVNPNLNLNDYSFNVVKADTAIAPAGNVPNATLPGKSLNVSAIVSNASPGSIAYPDGGNVTVFLNNKPIGVAVFAPELQNSHRRKLLQQGGLTSLFNIPLTIPLGTPSGLQQLILAFTGNGNFNPSTTGQNGSPQGFFINIPGATQTVIAGTANPSTTAAGAQSQITGSVTDPTGAGTPTGSVSLNVGGQNFGPYGLTNGQYSGPVTAPTVPTTITGAPYPVTVTYVPDTTSLGLYSNPSPPYTIPLNVSPASTTISETVSPSSTGTGSQVTASGTVTGSNGASPVGTVTTTVTGPAGATNYTVPINGPNYSNPFPAPGTTGSYSVASLFTPAPGNSLSPATSGPQPLAVTNATATVSEALVPDPANPGAAVVVNGTVTSPSGPLAGAVQLYLDGQPSGTPITLGPGGTYTTTIAAPGTVGPHAVRMDYIPSGSTIAAATTTQTLTVGTLIATATAPGDPAAGTGGPPGGGVAGLVNTALQLALGGGGGAQGFTFPGCTGKLAATVTSSPAGATGPITLGLSGGMLGDKNATLGTVDLSNGTAVFNLVSQKLDAIVIEKLVTKLQPLKNHSVDDIHDKLGSDSKLGGLLANKGVLPLLPGQYTLTATYPGNAGDAAGSVTAPWNIDALCLAQVLNLQA